MTGVFLSYRRVDTEAWAGRLFDHLSKRFGQGQVFMDIEGGIPRGADFEKTLSRALADCDALLALIGPAWASCTGDDGTARLERPDDWVRNEVRVALGRSVVVMPVLLGGARLPPADKVPEDIRLLCKRQWAEITDTRWAYDVGEIVKDLVKLTALPLFDDVAAAKTGIWLLKDLIGSVPAVADAASRSREVIASTSRQIGKLDGLKSIHDALHSIEFECLRPLQAGGPASRIRPYKVAFAAAARQIEDALREEGLIPRLRDDLQERLEVVRAAFDGALEEPGPAAQTRVVAELELLLSRLPSDLDAGISDAAAELELGRLVELVTTVGQTLEARAASKPEADLQLFADGADALRRLRDELRGRVAAHTALQRLDSKLRSVCVGGTALEGLALEWGRIKKVRAKLVAPSLPEVDDFMPDLLDVEGQVEAALARNDEPAALDLLREYFRTAAAVFRDVDRGLREFSLRLATVSKPLQAILDA